MRRLFGGLLVPALAVTLFVVLGSASARPVYASSCVGQYQHTASTTIGSLTVEDELVAALCSDGNWQWVNYLFSFGGNMTAPIQNSVRVWVCGTFQGTTSTYYSSNTNTTRTTTGEYSYGGCGLQADDSGSYFYVGSTKYSAPYVSF
jgi:hypothetical protein